MFVSIDVPNRKCTSCTQWPERPSECKLSDYEMYNCTDEQAVERIDNYGLPCCFKSAFLDPSDSNSIREIWLGEKYSV